ncbi:SAM-dependent methyltransferase [Streptomyces fulvorobeus]|uniref:Methyltransferase type 11 n=1 Tax=Streptomyces fulvorobeus TaxID=284028 RepID=A0A7J0CFT3_9ACTN|nr:methyltransferase domain-containing protein [Streptomyces fulvorobeus]NYE44134.1 ubiquinone/menaquinone biosynthesis C-methylase UbiE [Streptomyces fulvorobeus]GFN00645.1 methyltransferase type 11 [Streptomyces fulvorobeus]
MAQQPAPPALPVPDEVGRLYDRYTDLGSATLGENLHFGYWDTPDSPVPLTEATDRLTDLMTDRLHIGPGSRVLDLGCGTGRPALRIADRTGADVTGISISHKQVERATALAADRGLADRVRFERADAMDLPFAAGSFDAVIALESIIHMPDRARVLRQVARVLRPGGRLVLTDFFERAPIPDSGRPAVERYLREFMMTMVQAEDYPPLLRQAGLWFDELTDISGPTLRRTFIELSARINGSAQQLAADYGGELVEQFDPADMTDVEEFGHLLVVAVRPGR